MAENPFQTLWQTITGNTQPTGAGTGAGAGGSAAVGGPKGELLRWIANPPPGITFDANQKAALFAWLNGGALTDPALVAAVGQQPYLRALATQAGAGEVGGGGAVPVAGAAPVAAPPGAATGTPPGSGTTVQYPGGAAPATGAAPTAQPSLGGTPAAGGAPLLSPEAGMAMWEKPAIAGRQAARGAGLDPYGGGIASDYFGQLTDPIIQAMAPVFAFGQGGGSGGNVDPQAYANQITRFGQGMTTPGGGGLQMSRDLAQQVLSNPEFMSQLSGAYDSDQMNQLNALQQLRNPSASPLTQAYLAAQSGRLAARYNDQAMGIAPGSAVGQWGGRYTNYLDQDPEARALAERLYGYVPR